MQLVSSIHTNASIFDELKDEWLGLLERSITNYVFQTPQFQKAWWQSLGSGELKVVAIKDEQQKLVGLAPFFLNQNDKGQQELCFVGCVNVSDYLDIMVDREQQSAVYTELARVLTDELTEWQTAYLCSLPELSPTRDWLKQTFSSAKETQQDVSPRIELPASWEEYLASIDRKQRHEIKRKLRRVEETDHQFELITDSAASTQAISDFVALHKKSSAEKKDFWDDNHLKFFSSFIPASAEAGWLKLFFLKVEGTRTAAMLVFDYDNQYLLYNSGFDPDSFRNLSTGNVLTSYTIKHAIENKRAIYDFLRGDEQYKFRFGAVAKPVFDILIRKKSEGTNANT